MGVVSHGYGGWVRAGTEVVVDKHAGQSQDGGCLSRDSVEFCVCEVITLPFTYAALGRVGQELVDLPEKALTRHNLLQ